MADLIKIFFAGLTLANGPCLFFCVPVILPYIATMSEDNKGVPGWLKGLKLILIFSFFRLTAYSLLGFFSVTAYRFVFGFITPVGVYLQIILGIGIAVTGILYLLKNKPGKKSSLCTKMHEKAGKVSGFNMALFGLLVGFSPCPPLLATLTYIAATAQNPVSGLFSGMVFGVGTLITPLIPLGATAGHIIEKMKSTPMALFTLRLISAVILISLGFKLILF